MIFKRPINKNPLFFAFFFPALIDGIVTLLGQDAFYWTNKVINEASPAYYLLLASPWLFLLGSVMWFVFWYWFMKRLKEPFNLFFMFLFVAGHSWGSGGWIMKMLKQRGVYTIGNQASIIFAWSLLVVYFVLIGVFATYCLRYYLRARK